MNEDKNVLITGGYGFLGRYVGQAFSALGFGVHGIGHGFFQPEEQISFGYDSWLEADVTVDNLVSLGRKFDCVVHCAGGSSVASSLDNPARDFEKTVSTTLAVLEFVLTRSPDSLVIIPSSAAVYGEHDQSSISIDAPLSPVSPYGSSKKIAEELCLSYNKFFNVNISIVRFFSIFGPHLKKQLIWDACNKMLSATNEAVFWGTGEETRDWVYCTDAAKLITECFGSKNRPLIMNGGCGRGISIKETLDRLAKSLGVEDLRISFSGESRPGDPCHYQADLSEVDSVNWHPSVTLEQGLDNYADWFRGLKND